MVQRILLCNEIFTTCTFTHTHKHICRHSGPAHWCSLKSRSSLPSCSTFCMSCLWPFVTLNSVMCWLLSSEALNSNWPLSEYQQAAGKQRGFNAKRGKKNIPLHHSALIFTHLPPCQPTNPVWQASAVGQVWISCLFRHHLGSWISDAAQSETEYDSKERRERKRVCLFEKDCWCTRSLVLRTPGD